MLNRGGEIMQKYNKFGVALLGLILIGLNTFFGVDFGIDSEAAYSTVVSALTAAGVLGFANKEE